jgi:hypothetical protein
MTQIFVDNRPGTHNNLLLLITCVTTKSPKKHYLYQNETSFINNNNNNKPHNTRTRLLIFNYKLLNMARFLTFYHSKSAPRPPSKTLNPTQSDLVFPIPPPHSWGFVMHNLPPHSSGLLSITYPHIHRVY